MIKLAPSILAADFANLERDITAVREAGAQYLHIDVMDGAFVPNITVGPPVVKCLRKIKGIVFDVHLMIAEPQKYIESFARAGADIITVHTEAAGDIAESVSMIKALGVRSGVTIKPKTPVSAVLPVIDKVDLALIMSVEPGFGGQSLIEDTLLKVRELKDIVMERQLGVEIEVDGGVNFKTVDAVLEHGADIIVAGEAVFGSGNPAKAVGEFLEIFKKYERQ